MKQADYQLGYRSDIEGLRALAIALVIGAHAGVPGLAGGFVGVDVFFVLSGFLITGLLLRELAQDGSIDYAAFYLRRLRRLMPALLLMVVITSLVAMVLLAPGEQLSQPSAAGLAALWISNIYFALAKMDYFSPGTDSNLFLHTWSLGVEEQFYLVWPWLLVVALGRGRQLARLRWGMLGVVVGGACASVLLTPHYPQFAFYMMPIRSWEFAAGAWIWLGFRGRASGLNGEPVRTVWVHAMGWLGLLAIVIPAMTYSGSMAYPGWRACIPVLGAAAVVWAGSHGVVTGAGRLLSWSPLQAVGRISYSWYLWHWPALLLAAAVADTNSPWVRLTAVAVSLLLAMLSYRWVEYPIRHQAWWLERRRLAVAVGLVAVVLLNLMTMHWFEAAGARMASPVMQRYAQARDDSPAIYAQGCDDWYHSSLVRPCVFGDAHATHTAVLIGDSVAGQWSPAFARVFARPGWRWVVLTKSSCPMVDVPLFYARIGREYTECAIWRRDALTRVAEWHPDVVVLSTVATNDFRAEQWVEGSARVLASLHTAAKVFVLRGTPHLPFNGPDCLAAHEGRPAWLGGSRACQAPLADPHDAQVFAWLQQAAARFGNVRTIDMNDLICPQATCAAQRQGTMVYRDSQHLTASFAASLAPELGRRLGMDGDGASMAGARP